MASNKHHGRMFTPVDIDIDREERSFSDLDRAPVPVGPPCTAPSVGRTHLAGLPKFNDSGSMDAASWPGELSIKDSPPSVGKMASRARRRQRQLQQHRQQIVRFQRAKAQGVDISSQSSLRISFHGLPASYFQSDTFNPFPKTTPKSSEVENMSLSFAGGSGLASVLAWPLPSIYTPSTNFNLTANNVPVAVVSNVEYEHGHFDMGDNGNVELVITVLDPAGAGEDITAENIRISPEKLGLTPQVSGDNVTITLPHDQYLIVKIGELPELVIIADALETAKPAVNGTGIYNVASAPYNADSTGATLTTDAFQNAINNASADFTSLSASNSSISQAVVYVPNGVYTVGNIVLQSNVALYLEGSAVLHFTGNPDDYRVDYFKTSQGRNVTWWVSTAFNSENIKVFGRGTIDGNGFDATTTFNFGNNNLVPIATTNFVADGIQIRNSGAWSVTPIRSSNVQFTNIKFLNRVLNMGENDCIDVNESSDVSITHCIGISLDDPYSTKTWTSSFTGADIAVNWPGSPQPLERVTFDDNISWTRTFGFKVGQGTVQDQSDITFSNGVVYDCSIGIGINHRYGNASVNNVIFSNIDIESASLLLENRSSWEAIFTEDADNFGGGPVTNVTIEDINVRDLGSTACQLSGLFNNTIDGVTFQNITVPGSSTPATTLEQMNVTDVFFAENIKVIA